MPMTVGLHDVAAHQPERRAWRGFARYDGWASAEPDLTWLLPGDAWAEDRR
ncbi:MAG: hypothetical protein ABSC95_28815 [Acetobacteraceae bacterium]|jgi:hypothetical protein